MVRKKTNSERISDPSGGANQIRVRAYNERLVLSLVRRHGQLSKSEIARRTGLSAQTVSVIMRALEADGLLLRGSPVRGKVGQPSVPMAINPKGAFAFGLKVDRRNADLILINFVGENLRCLSIQYPYPQPEELIEFATNGIAELSKEITKKDQSKIAGIGIGIPFQLWMWESKVGAPQGSMDVWKTFDFAHNLAKRTNLLTFTQNDATAACGAELTFGRGAEFSDFVYFFIGTFIGGGVVLNHSVYAGRTGNAGALGSLPIKQNDSTTCQLLDYASLYQLEHMLLEDGKNPALLYDDSEDWSELGDIIDRWLCNSANHIAMSIVAASSVIDFEAAIIDGAIPPAVRDRLVKKVKSETERLDLQGVTLPKILAGNVGANARALGAATLPLFDRYLLDQSVLFKERG